METAKRKSEELAVYWAQHQPVVAGYICSLVSNFQDADDILQNVALVTVEKFEDYDDSRSFVAWAIGIARNVVLKYYSQKKKDHITLDHQTIQAISTVYEEDIGSITSRNDRIKNALDRCMQQLKGKWRKVFEMYYLRELSSTRIAQQLGMTRNNVFVSLHRIRIVLRDCVKDQLQQD